MNGWHNASSREHCPICGKSDWCSISDDGNVVCCRRTPSDWPTKSGNGWLHRIGGEPGSFNANKDRGISSSPLDSALCVKKHFDNLERGDIQIRLHRYLSRELGLPEPQFAAMDVKWDNAAKAVAFPMRDATGEVTGIRYRKLKTGDKWSMKGSKDGLFMLTNLEESISSTLITHTSSLAHSENELVICEGPTDTLAAGACGIWAVGRSSCTSGTRVINEFIVRHKVKRVTIAADDDKLHTRPDGTTWKPGLEGAKRLQRDLIVPSRIVFPAPGFKDLREWYMKGAMTLEKFKIAMASAEWFTPSVA